MSDSPASRRIAVLDISGGKWIGGSTFTSVVARSLAAVSDQSEFLLELVASEQLVAECEKEGWGLTAVPFRSRRSTEPRSPSLTLMRSLNLAHPRLRRLVGLPALSDPVSVARKRGADVVLPVTRASHLGSTKAIGWIPDFQHLHLPHFFDESERLRRDRAFRRVAANCDLVMLSSEDAKKDFVTAFPKFTNKARVAQFPSLLAFNPPTGDAHRVRVKYGLPDRFALVINQFWRHKNHLLVVDAVRRAREAGVEIPLVMVGTPTDHRDSRNKTLSDVLQVIATSRLREQTWLLGEVPRADLIDILRCSAVLIQPSRAEGWSTSVQDAKALDRPVLSANLPVLKEQAQDALAHFDVDSAEELSRALIAHWADLGGGPSPREVESLAHHYQAALQYGEVLLGLCREVIGTSDVRVR